MLVLQRELKSAGVPQATATVRVQDLATCDGMILCNSRGWAPVGRVDDVPIAPDATFTAAVAAAYDGCPRDAI
jgi:branched-subunit amino acid aminotransferase/4-amino-4-deoxychorismate lyase